MKTCKRTLRLVDARRLGVVFCETYSSEDYTDFTIVWRPHIRNTSDWARRLVAFPARFGDYTESGPEQEKLVLSMLDREISLRGPKALLFDSSFECRKKDTSDVAESKMQDGDLHGGDSASQEVDSGQSAGGDQADNISCGGGKPQEDGDSKTGQGSGDLTPEALEYLGEGADEPKGTEGEGDGPETEEGDDRRSPSSNSGSCLYAQYSGRTDKEALRAVRKGLKALFRAMGGPVGTTGSESPRTDAKKLVKELVGKSVRMSRTKREELDSLYKLVLVDTSASCSVSCNEFWYVAKTLVQQDESLIVIAHSNGCVDRVDDRNLPGGAPAVATFGRKIEWWQELIRAVKFQGTLCLGDDHGSWAFKLLSETGAPFYWADSYAAQHGVKPASAGLREVAKDWQVQPTGWIQGVSGARELALALRMFARKEA